MSKPLVLIATCSMAAVFVAMYFFVEYLTAGTELAAPAAPAQGALLREGSATPGPGRQATAPAESTATHSVAGSSVETAPPTQTPTMPPVVLPPTATPSGTATAEAVVIPAMPPPTATALPPDYRSAPTAEAAHTAPTSIPTATEAEDTDAEFVQLVAGVEEQVSTGQLQASIESDQGVISRSSITFDLGNAAYSARMHYVSSYASTTGERMTELIVIGEQFWERVDNGPWIEVGAREGVWGQVHSFLPGLAAVADMNQVSVDAGELSWTDQVRDIDLTLTVDPLTGVPLELRRASRTSGQVVIVTYSGWNAPVDIQMPSGP